MEVPTPGNRGVRGYGMRKGGCRGTWVDLGANYTRPLSLRGTAPLPYVCRGSPPTAVASGAPLDWSFDSWFGRRKRQGPKKGLGLRTARGKGGYTQPLPTGLTPPSKKKNFFKKTKKIMSLLSLYPFHFTYISPPTIPNPDPPRLTYSSPHTRRGGTSQGRAPY